MVFKFQPFLNNINFDRRNQSVLCQKQKGKSTYICALLQCIAHSCLPVQRGGAERARIEGETVGKDQETLWNLANKNLREKRREGEKENEKKKVSYFSCRSLCCMGIT